MSVQLDRPRSAVHNVAIPPLGLAGLLTLPHEATGIVAFVHGSGSSRLSPRNTYVAQSFNDAGFATLLFDLLTAREETNRQNVFDIPLLAERLIGAVQWVMSDPRSAHLPLGLFGASTGAAAALVAAACLDRKVRAVVSRGGRADLADAALPEVEAPTLLIVGGDDTQVLALNRSALARMHCTKTLKVVPGATHLFEEPGTLDIVVAEASEWFKEHLTAERLAQG
ncbi:dienelactone hydrolase family protein [Pseudaminobacter sp. 19-2017]|uniref:Dienelactone hydrolase family protein n=1 Tax=Pseudaminobacter soli (ex Zhang et al. 2022) TaxID=2831468 RepID=A0A942DZX8_9HYPH|nr:dienelactone hydrolase family protein [Pseudaminobacter soli]MBS3650518.1 dienelactone hydrolase family protein [Pseudaminobacter soli]